MKFLTAIQKTAKEKLRDEKGFVWAFEVEVPTTPATRYRLVGYTEEVAHGTNSLGQALIYSPFPIAHGGIEQSSQGDLPTIDITVGNASREIMAVLEAYNGLIGQPVDVKLLYVDEFGTGTAVHHETAQITGCTANNERIVFRAAAFDLYKARFPARRYVAKHCRFQFGSAECGYAIALGSFTECGKTLAQCTERGDDEFNTGQTRQHPERFGGWLGIPRQRAGAA